MNEVLQAMKEQKIISIIRAESPDDLKEVAASLYRGGVRILEITMNTPGALEAIKQIKENHPDLWVGAGTVLDEETARLAIMAGASFLLSPTLSEASIRMASRYNIPFIPGVLTPTEALTAYEWGARVVKVFPVGSLGAAYIKYLKGPLPHLEMVPVGGVSNETAEAFLEAGSFALGIGSTLVNDTLIKEKQFPEIERRARELVETVSAFSG